MGESTSQGLITSCASRSTLYAPLGWWLRNSCGGNGASSDSLPHRSHSTVEKGCAVCFQPPSAPFLKGSTQNGDGVDDEDEEAAPRPRAWPAG